IGSKQGGQKPAAKTKVQNKQQEQKKVNQPQSRENRTMPVNDQNTKVCLFEPRVFAETQDIADELKSNRAALVNLTKIDSVPKKRIVDFLSGTGYALEGDIRKVGADIFLCTPNSFGVEGEISDKEEFFDEMYGELVWIIHYLSQFYCISGSFLTSSGRFLHGD